LGAVGRATLFAVAVIGGSAWAQPSYPSRPVRILVPFPPGGAADTIARSIGDQMAVQLAQPVVIDNRTGAGGRIATELTVNANPDGYTLLVGTVGGIAVSPALYRKLPYDPQRDLLPVSHVAEIINILAVPATLGVGTVREFLDWARARSDPPRYGSSGTGQPDHLAGELLQRLAGVPLSHVPYKGGGPALIDLMAGDLQLMFATYVVSLPHIKAGRLRMIAVTTPARQPLLPEVPTVGETVPGFGLSNWNGVFLPGRTPAPIADRLHAEINRALQAPEVRRRQAAAGIEPGGSPTRAHFAGFVREETARWARIVREAKIVVE
jgi:tripartite-type tricarboxylate transporter receptor subunit TctC